VQGLVKVSGNTASTMKNYDVLQSKLAAINPSTTSSKAYNPTNSPQACPNIGPTWQANEQLPPTPNSDVCNCMFNSLSCVPQPNLDSKSYGSIFGFICGKNAALCAGISENTMTGVYGAFSMCNDTQKLGNVLDAYYKSLNSASGACDFQGQAMTTAPAAAAASCSAILSSASAANSFAATATAASSKSSNVAAPVPIKNAFTIGEFTVGLYVLVAMGVGAGMLVL
jgi:hypothetical protein